MRGNIYQDKIDFMNRFESDVAIYPTVSREYLHEIEQTFAIKFPEDFKFFYSEISNGICVNNNTINEKEIYNIETVLKKIKETEKKFGIFKKDLITQTFPFDKPYIWGDEGSFDLHLEVEYGNIEVANVGDGETWNLILSGSSCGNVWNFSEWGISPCNPNLTFLRWAEMWLTNQKFSY